jgi:hypothetical protein
LGALSIAALATVWTLLAASVPDPALKISLTGTNQLLLNVTNGLSTANYEIQRRAILADPSYPWTPHLTGTLGQTNFTVNMGIETIGFFKATAGLDWDQDGIPNWMDGDPSNTNVLRLSITIESPLHGTIFN